MTRSVKPELMDSPDVAGAILDRFHRDLSRVNHLLGTYPTIERFLRSEPRSLAALKILENPQAIIHLERAADIFDGVREFVVSQRAAIERHPHALIAFGMPWIVAPGLRKRVPQPSPCGTLPFPVPEKPIVDHRSRLCRHRTTAA